LGFLREFLGTVLYGISWIIVIVCAIAFVAFFFSAQYVGCLVMAATVAVVWGLSKGFRKLWPDTSSQGFNQPEG